MEDHNYGEEQKLVVNSFQQGFTNKRNQKIVFTIWVLNRIIKHSF